MSHWQWEPQQLLPLLALGCAYAVRVRALAERGRPVPRRRRWSFAAGLLVTALALVSPIDWWGENRRLWVHMVQHLLLGDVAPLLVILGLTGPVLRPLLANRAVRALRPLAHPLVALPVWIGNLYLWHLPAPYQAALDHNDIHALEHLCFFAFGALMWAAVIEPLPGPSWFGNGFKALYTLVVRVAGMALAMVFIWDNHPLYHYYVVREASPVSDQRTAGLVMFTEGSIVTVLAFAWLFLRFIREMEVRQRLIDGQLDPALAARAARYGRAARARDVMP
ncbi:MAG TPA: cytochrome c oxidase assembly protein [Solirubrobacteraceae bacterium]|nr:cytochrome c oxidase assembly protein [Solirubrobacteraceae bacterium]